MSRSIRSILGCLGVPNTGDVSVLGDLFGFLRRRVPTDPAGPAEVRVLRLMNDLKGKHVHINVIRVGIDNFTADEVEKIDFAILRCRDIYRPQSFTLGRVLHWDISSADAGGRDDIGSEDEAEELTHEWTVDNDAIDVFMVDVISDDDFIGLSPVEGPCDKDDKDMNGVLGGEVNRSFDGVARTFAHEIGHYLGLSHTSDGDNLMTQTKNANSIRNSVLLTNGQGSDLRDHCFVKNGC